VALESGFTEAGLVALPYAHQERDALRYEQWVRAGRAGTMRYLERRDDSGRLLRSRTGIPFPWARSVLVGWASYNSAQPLSTDPAPAGAGWIARYAWSSRLDASGQRHSSDYHKVLLKRMKSVEARLHEELGVFEARAFVDTGPLAERANLMLIGGELQIGYKRTLNAFGLVYEVPAYMTGSFGRKDNHVVFEPHQVYLGSCPLHRLPGLAGVMSRRTFAALKLPEKLTSAWEKVSDVSVENSLLKISMAP